MSLASVVKRVLPPRVLLPLIARRHRWYRGERDLKLLDRLVDPRRNSVDVGANVGVYTYWLSRLSRHVYAYEPNPDNLRFLTRGARRNVTVRQVALSDKDGTATLQLPDLGRGFSAGHGSLEKTSWPTRGFEVPVRRLDDERLADVGFVKVDVEGHELSVLAGGRELLASQRPTLLVEIEQRSDGRDVRAAIATVQAYGYDAYFEWGGRLMPLSRYETDAEQHVTIDGVRRYIFNFIFLPAGSAAPI